VGLAARGSFLCGGAYAPQPRLAKFALAATFLVGLSALGFLAKVVVGMECVEPVDYFPFEIGRRGQVLVVHKANDSLDGRILSIMDLSGQVPAELAGERMDAFAFRKAIARGAMAGQRPKTVSYRNRNRFLRQFKNATTPGTEVWWYVSAQGRALGYDKQTKRLIGSFGPEGFVDPGEPSGEPFQGEPAFDGLGYQAWARYPLAFSDGAFTVDFRKGRVQKVFAPPLGETVLWASQREDEQEKWSLLFIGTEEWLHVLDPAGKPLFSAPLVGDMEKYRLMAVGRLENPRRYWVSYLSQWQFTLATLETMPELQLVIYDEGGREILPRQIVPPRPGAVRDFPTGQPLVRPSMFQALSGLATSPVEVAALVGTTALLESQARERDGREASLPLQFLTYSTQLFIPGVCWDLHGHPGLAFTFAAFMLLVSLLCGGGCFWLTRSHAFSPARRIGWTVVGLLFGPTGFLLLITLLEWPVQIVCPNCRLPRVVSGELCEHCGAAHALPISDGTEIFEEDKVDCVPVLFC
jgi:hypothetical protein